MSAQVNGEKRKSDTYVNIHIYLDDCKFVTDL